MDPIQYYIARGPVRGTISTHRTESACRKAVVRDRAACRKAGGYSDAGVFAKHSSGNMTGPYRFYHGPDNNGRTVIADINPA